MTDTLPTGSYLVFAVESGDRLSVLLPPREGDKLPSTKGIIVSNVNCPKIGRAGKEDEPCAYDALELLRATSIGKIIKFQSEFEVDVLARTGGRVTLPNGDDAAATLIKNGLGVVNDREPVRMDPARAQQLQKLQLDAKATKRGRWNPNAAARVRPLLPFPPADIDGLAKDLKGREVKVHVDRVQSPSSLFVSLLESGQPLLLHLSGITGVREKEDGAVAAEAKYFVEKLLLNRHVVVRFEGVDGFLNMLGSIVSPKGTFQAELVGKGYAKVAANSLAFLTDAAEREALRKGEAAAQEKHAGVWAGAAAETVVAPAASAAATAAGTTPGAPSPAPVVVAATVGPRNDFKGSLNFEATLVQVISGDFVVLRPTAGGEYVRLSLSGVRVAKSLKDTHTGPESRVTYPDYSWEAKELLRTQFIGHTVNVHVDYTRTIEETKEIRPSGTVVDAASSVNLAAAVLEAGYGRFFLGKTDACSGASLLQEAEAIAQSRAVGIHSTQQPPQVKITELGRLGDAKGKYYLSFLQRGIVGGRAPVLKGIVDVVIGAGAFRIHVPKEHFQIGFRLAGVITPAAGDAFDAEAKEFSVLLLQQREVELQVETSDRGGNFIGTLLFNGRSYAEVLLEKGFAAVSAIGRSANSSGALVEAEAVARDAKLNIWSAAAAAPQRLQKQEEEQRALGGLTASSDAWRNVTIVNVLDGTTLALAFPETAQLRADIADASRTLGGEGVHAAAKKNEVIVALYREDKSWNRAKVLRMGKESAEVQFIDFGNREEVKLKDLRRIPTSAEYTFVRESPSTTVIASLSGLRPVTEEAAQCDICCDFVWAYAERGNLQARKEYTDGTNNFYALRASESASAETLTEYLLKEGVALMDKRAADVLAPAALAKHRAAQDVAHRHHRVLWLHGDAGADDEEDA